MLTSWLRGRRRSSRDSEHASGGDDSADSDAAAEWAGESGSGSRRAPLLARLATGLRGGGGVAGSPLPERLDLDAAAPPAVADGCVRPGFAWCAATAAEAVHAASTGAPTPAPLTQPDKPHCQDEILLRPGFAGVRGATLAGVFDGHGKHGRAAAVVAAAAFADALEGDARALARGRAQRVAAFEAAAAAAHAAVVAALPDARLSGTAACVALHTPDGGLAVANVGDSRAILGRVGDDGRPEAVLLSRDHTPDVEAERQRIMRAGGSVRRPRGARGEATGVYRVYGRTPAELAAGTPGLAMSRSLGDTAAHALGVSPHPSVRLHAPGDGDLCLVLATDGVWDVVDPAEAVALVVGTRLAPLTGLTAADAVTAEAHERWKARRAAASVDDVAAVVLHLCEAPLGARSAREPPQGLAPGFASCDDANGGPAVAARSLVALAPPHSWFEAAMAAGARDAGGCTSSAAGSEASASTAAAAAQRDAAPRIARASSADIGGETLRAGRSRRPAAGRYERAESPEAADVAFAGDQAQPPPLPPPLPALRPTLVAGTPLSPLSASRSLTARMSRPTPIPEDAPARAVTAPRPVRLPRVLKAYPGGGGSVPGAFDSAASAPGVSSTLFGRTRSLSGSWLAFGSAGSLGASLGGGVGSSNSLALAGSAGSVGVLSAASSGDDGGGPLAAAAAADERGRGRRGAWRPPSVGSPPPPAPESSGGESERRVHGGAFARAASSGRGWDGPASAPVGWSLASFASSPGGALAAAAARDESTPSDDGGTPRRGGRPPVPRPRSSGGVRPEEDAAPR